MLTIKNKKSKKSKHGKKNWRKNIDVSEIEHSQQKLNQEKIKTQKIKEIKDNDLFELDTNLDDLKQEKGKEKSLIGKKTKRPKKFSKQEQRQIKRIIEISSSKAIQNNLKKDKENENKIFDLWGSSTNDNSNKNNKENLSYPKVPLPHPGQSYNPNKKDLNNLLTTVVENNKYLVKEEEESDNNEDVNVFDDEESH